MQEGQSNIAYYAMYAAETASTAVHEAACMIKQTPLFRHEVKQVVKNMQELSKNYTNEAEKVVATHLDSVEDVYYKLEAILKPKADLLRIAIKQELDDVRCVYSNEISYLLLAHFLCEHSNDVTKAATILVKRGNTSFSVKNGKFELDIPLFKDSVLDKALEFSKLTKKCGELISKQIVSGVIDLNSPKILALSEGYIGLMFDQKVIDEVIG